MKGLTDIPGVWVGHASDYDGLTGCTAILCESGAVAGGDIRGSATGTEEWDLLDPRHVTARIHAVVLAGGSAFGLEAASGVRRYLEHKGIGFDTGAAKVPLVPCAILYDLNIGKASARPTREMGEAAAGAASDKAVGEGAVGAGTGATVGKLLGIRQAMKSGIGSWTVELNGGVKVAALAAVNAVGDVRDPSTGKIVAGARTAAASMEFADSAKVMKGGRGSGFARSNTTLVVVATNVRLNKVEATKIAQLAHLGVARAISPVNTMSDGDVVIALSIGNLNTPIDTLGVAAAEATAESILRAVRLAPTLGGVPGLKK
jgi:L-aminopeptidase/D-esterase-like protein